ncbi:hypothetical protein GF377_00370 [candidate division GN15 bacterium]|nr:hypothetical protein [candidate division GN15 bacterium]
MVKDITIPDIGEKVEEGQVVGILVEVGDVVELEQGIVEFETDKAVVEIPSPEKGRITEIMVSKGDTVKVGKAIAKIDTDTEKSADKEEQQKPEAEESKAKPKQEEPEPEKAEKKESRQEPEEEPEKEPKKEARKEAPDKEAESRPAPKQAQDDEEPSIPGDAIPASPAVRRLARELGVDLRQVSPGGLGGRITADDVKRHVKHGTSTPKGGPSMHASALTKMPDFSQWGEVEEEQVSQVRSAIADAVSTSWHTVPHVTQFDQADITNLNTFLKNKKKMADKAGVKLTVSAVILKVIAEGLKKFPRFNSSFHPGNKTLYLKKYYHIGVAVDTERGLLVPVLRDVDKKSVITIAKELNDLAERARNRKLNLDDMEGGTFSLSNQGAIGGVNFTPIVLWPQVAILGVSRGSVQPLYVDDEFQAREVLPLALSYDHRVIDGADAVRFLKWIADSLENPINMHLED